MRVTHLNLNLESPLNNTYSHYMAHGDRLQFQELIRQLESLRSEMLSLEAAGLSGGGQVHPENQASAKNLLHYLALRRHDIRPLQGLTPGAVLTDRAKELVIIAICDSYRPRRADSGQP